jgi:hypothetical protein
VPTPTADAEGSAPCAGVAEELGWSLRSKQAAPEDRPLALLFLFR